MFLFDLFETINELRSKVYALEKELSELKEQKEKEILNIKRQFTKIRCQQELSQLMINEEAEYTDLSPRKAIEIYRNPDKNFLILDITENHDRADAKLVGSQHIPFSELKERYNEINSKNAPLLVISKKGLKSILACEFLAQQGFLNVNNVSGGFMLWGRFENSLLKFSA